MRRLWRVAVAMVAAIMEYVTTHPVPHNLAVGTPSEVLQIEFLPSHEVSVLLGGESTGTPDAAVLCYVELQGTFVFPGPNGTALTYQRAVEVFDGQTGNLLIVGGHL